MDQYGWFRNYPTAFGEILQYQIKEKIERLSERLSSDSRLEKVRYDF
jgi:hypothetical protein